VSKPYFFVGILKLTDNLQYECECEKEEKYSNIFAP